MGIRHDWAAACAIAASLGFPGQAPAGAWQTPSPGQHPRLIFSKHDLPALRAKLDDPLGRWRFKRLQRMARDWVLRDGSAVNKALRLLAAEPAQTQPSAKDTPAQRKRKAAVRGQCDEALSLCELAALVYAVNGEERYGRAAVGAMLKIVPHVDGGHNLRPVALVYDWCHPLLSEQERAVVRQTIDRWARAIVPGIRNDPWSLGPNPVHYANYWGLLQASLAGIGELAIEGEPGFKQDVLDLCLKCTDLSFSRFLDTEGCHESGPAYLGYGFYMTKYYMEALRLRGRDWSKHPRLRKMLAWYTYLIEPGAFGGGPTLLKVGTSNWGLQMACDAFIWLHHAMPDNPYAALAHRHVMEPGNDNMAWRTTAELFLWDRPFEPLPDLKAMPRTKWFPDGGVFMRTGWDANDVAFWIQSRQNRRTPGKHEDPGSFYLHAYGEPFATEAGAKFYTAAGHSVVFVDGRATDRHSNVIWPATPLRDLVAGDFASAALVDQKESYSEELFFDDKRERVISKPLNPMRKVQRIGCLVWGGYHEGPYALIVDDIDKDGQAHDYQWRMMTNPNHAMNDRRGFVTLSRAKASHERWDPPAMDCALLSPVGTFTFAEATERKQRVTRLLVDAKATNPHFTVCLYPRMQSGANHRMPALACERLTGGGGHGAVLRWRACLDRVVVSYGGPVAIGGVETDARLAVVRCALPPLGSKTPFGEVLAYLMVQGSVLAVDGRPVVKANSGRCSVSVDHAQGTAALGTGTSEKDLTFGVRMNRFTRYSGRIPE